MCDNYCISQISCFSRNFSHCKKLQEIPNIVIRIFISFLAFFISRYRISRNFSQCENNYRIKWEIARNAINLLHLSCRKCEKFITFLAFLTNARNSRNQCDNYHDFFLAFLHFLHFSVLPKIIYRTCLVQNHDIHLHSMWWKEPL